MPERHRYVCIVCGRVFPEGQGIIIKRAGIELAFHSKTCLTKFFKRFVEVVDESEFKRVVREVRREFEEALKAKRREKII
ncbi:MAG: hypothetical protein ABWW69_07345 [Pyrodictiaceae archaeon]